MTFFENLDSLLEDIANVGGDTAYEELQTTQEIHTEIEPSFLLPEPEEDVLPTTDQDVVPLEESISDSNFRSNLLLSDEQDRREKKTVRTQSLTLSPRRPAKLRPTASDIFSEQPKHQSESPTFLRKPLQLSSLPGEPYKYLSVSSLPPIAPVPKIRRLQFTNSIPDGILQKRSDGGSPYKGPEVPPPDPEEDDPSLNLPPVIFDKLNKFVHEPMSRKLEEFFLVDPHDLYDEKFYSHIHLNFIGTHTKKEGEYAIASVLKQPSEGKYYGLKTHKKGSETFYIEKERVESSTNADGKGTLAERIEEILKEDTKDIDWYSCENPNFPNDLRLIEKKHPQKQRTLKIAFLYSRGTEKTLQDFFSYREDNIDKERYFKFLNLLGERIKLLGWKKYRGDIGVEIDQDSYYTEWKEKEIMFHVCLFLNSEQHRRLIGNDVVFIIFYDHKAYPQGELKEEEDTGHLSFDPGALDALGTVPQVFGVVKEEEDNYRIGFFSRPTIKPYLPVVPKYHAFPPSQLKDFLFTKAYNGYCQALSCPPMNRLFEVPRANTIAEMVAKYPRASTKEIAMTEKAAQKRRQILTDKIKDPLLLLVTVNSIEMTKPASNCYVTLTLLEMEMKSKTTKEKSSKIEFQNEILPFNVIAVDPALNYLRIAIKIDKGPKVKKHPHVAEAEIPFREICGNLEKPATFPLSSENKETGPASINLAFMLKGPAAKLCPQCNLFLGSADLVVWKDIKYHQRCILCVKCSKPTAEDFKLRSGEFFCRKCFLKNFDDEGASDEDEKTEGGKGVPAGTFNFAGVTSKHNWTEYTSKSALTWCGFCGNHMGFNSIGYMCSECKYPCHKECKQDIPANCSHDPKTQQFHTKPTDGLKKVGGRVGKITAEAGKGFAKATSTTPTKQKPTNPQRAGGGSGGSGGGGGGFTKINDPKERVTRRKSFKSVKSALILKAGLVADKEPLCDRTEETPEKILVLSDPVVLEKEKEVEEMMVQRKLMKSKSQGNVKMQLHL